MLHLEYTTSCFMAKRNKQARQDISLFCSEQSLYLRLNVNMFFLFVCLSDPSDFLFHCVPNTLTRDFLSALLIYRGKIKIIFRWHCRPRKLKSAKNNRHIFKTKPRKFGNAKISHYTVWYLRYIIPKTYPSFCCYRNALSKWCQMTSALHRFYDVMVIYITLRFTKSHHGALYHAPFYQNPS